MKAEVSTKGDVVAVDFVSGHPLLAPAAVVAAKQWKYRPYMLNGQPIAMETLITLKFELAR